MIKFKDARLLFPVNASDEEIGRRFAEKFGRPPESILRDEQGAWAGPIVADEEQAARAKVAS